MKVLSKWFVIGVLALFCCCESPQTPSSGLPASAPDTGKKPEFVKQQQPKALKPLTTPIKHKDYHPIYPWKKSTAKQHTITHIPPPVGYQRKELQDNQQFAYWLRHLPLNPPGSKVYLHNGRKKPYQQGAHSVLDIDIGKRDLQQCADAVIRLKAEYHYSLKQFEDIHFNYTSGHTVSFEDWRKGKKPKVSGSSVSFTNLNGKTDNSYRNFKKYMTAIFNYAGTASLSKELKPVQIADMQIGDVFIQGGFPGHAVIVLDMAVHPTTEKKMFLVAQSYMPAQSIHVLKNLKNKDLSPWYPLDFEGALHTPEWQFSKSDLKRFQ